MAFRKIKIKGISEPLKWDRPHLYRGVETGTYYIRNSSKKKIKNRWRLWFEYYFVFYSLIRACFDFKQDADIDWAGLRFYQIRIGSDGIPSGTLIPLKPTKADPDLDPIPFHICVSCLHLIRCSTDNAHLADLRHLSQAVQRDLHLEALQVAPICFDCRREIQLGERSLDQTTRKVHRQLWPVFLKGGLFGDEEECTGLEGCSPKEAE